MAHADDCGQLLVNGDELRRLALPEHVVGHLASDVDELVLRVAEAMDAGRPVGALVGNVSLRMAEPVTLRQVLRPERRARAYDRAAVHWLLGQLRRYDDDRDRARLEADPWRHRPPRTSPSAERAPGRPGRPPSPLLPRRIGPR